MNGFLQDILESFPYKASKDQWADAEGVANEILGLRAEADVDNTMDSGIGTHAERRATAHSIPQNSLNVPEGGLNDPDIDGYVRVAKLVDYKYQPPENEDVENLRTFKLMHAPNDGDDRMFTFELIDKNGQLGDVFNSLKKPDWLVWCYTKMVLVCDANAFLAELNNIYNTGDLDILKEFTSLFIDRLEAAKTDDDTAKAMNEYLDVIGNFAAYVAKNNGKLFRGDNGEFMVSIPAKALTKRFPVKEYQTLHGALERNKPDMNEADADRRREREMLDNQQTDLFKYWDAALKKIVDGTYLTSKEWGDSSQRLDPASGSRRNGKLFDETHLQKVAPTLLFQTKNDPNGIWPVDANGTKQGPVHLKRRDHLVGTSPTQSLGRVIRIGPRFGTIPRLPEYLRSETKKNNWAGITDEGIIFVVDESGTLYTFYQQYEWWNTQRFAGDQGTGDVDEKPTKKSFLNLAEPSDVVGAVPRYVWRRIAERPPMPSSIQPPPNKRNKRK